MGRGADSPSHRSERFLFLVLIVVIHDLVVSIIILLTVRAGLRAAVLAAQILSVSDDALAAKLDAAREKMAAQIAEKEQKLQAELAQ